MMKLTKRQVDILALPTDAALSDDELAEVVCDSFWVWEECPQPRRIGILRDLSRLANKLTVTNEPWGFDIVRDYERGNLL
jgi:hypothetical protein